VRRVKAQEVSYGGIYFAYMSSVITTFPRFKEPVFVFYFYKNLQKFLFLFFTLFRVGKSEWESL